MKTRKLITTMLALGLSLMSFGQAPNVSTNDATRVFGNSAVLNGYVNPNGSTAEAYFIYWQSGSSKVDTSQRYTKSNSGFISHPVTNLNEQTSYEYMFVAKNSNGTSYGSTNYFNTPSTGLPNAELWWVNANDTNQLGVDGYFFANGLVATTWYQYDTIPDSFRMVTKKIIQPETQSNNWFNMNTNMREDIKNLKEYKKYYVRLAVKNDSGIVYSQTKTVVTQSGKPPMVVTDSATNVTSSTVTLNVKFDGLANCAFAYFEYGKSAKSLNSSTRNYSSNFSWNCEYGWFSYSYEIYGLDPNTTYHFRGVSESNRGKSYGKTISVKTEGTYAPEVLTLAETNVSYTTATLNGYYNAQGAPSTEISFQHGETIYLGTETAPVAFTKDKDTVKVNIKGIKSGTKHYYRIKSKTKFGTSYGSLVEFTTSFNNPPSVNTDSLRVISTSQINVFGSFNSNKTATKTWFEYDTVPNRFSQSTSKSSQGTSTGNISETLSGLVPNHTYFVRSASENQFGIAYGKTITATTLNNQKPLAITDSANIVSTTYAILTGFADGRKSDSKVSFEWGKSSTMLNNETTITDFGKGLSYPLIPIYGLDAYSTYYYRIKVVNIWGVSRGQVYKIKTLPNKEAVVKILDISGITQTSAKISVAIDGRGTISDFAINFGKDLCLTKQTKFFTSLRVLDTVTIVLSGLEPNSHYYLAPISNNVFGSMQGNVKDLNTLNNQPPVVKVQSVSTTPTVITFNGFYNSKKTSTDAWVIHKKKNSLWLKTSVLTGKSDSGSFTLSSNYVEPNTWYYYKAFAKNVFGIDSTNVDSVLTPGNQKPVVKTLTPIVSDTYAILFAEVDGQGTETSGEFIYGTDPNDLYKIADKFNSGNFKQTVEGIMYGLKPGTKYYFYPSAGNIWGSENGSISSFTTLDFTPTKKKVFPKIIAVNAEGGTDYAVITAQISSKSELAWYWVNYGDGSLSRISHSYDTGIQIVTIVLKHVFLHSTQKCLFYLQNANGKDSMWVEFTTLPNRTPIVKTLSVMQLDDSTIFVDGQYNAMGSAPVRYYFQYSEDFSFSNTAPVRFSTNDSDIVYCVFPKPKQGTTYHFRLVCENKIGITEGNIIVLKTKEKAKSASAGITKSNGKVVGTKVYPNPFSNELHIEAEKGSDLVFINIQGAVVHTVSLQNDSEQINLDSLPAGLYIVQISKDDIISRFKILKQ